MNTRDMFEERKKELEFYFSVLLDIDNDANKTINTINNSIFFRILKSNFLLMLYNIVEATVISGILEIYEAVKENNCTYSMVIDELKTIWRDNKIKEIYLSNSQLSAYTKRVKLIVENITSDTPIDLNKSMIDISGNLNAKKIKKICDLHRIRYKVIDDNMILEDVKKKRNLLAHGDESFSHCARNLTISDLETIKDTVLNFLLGILNGMEKYYNEKQYLDKEKYIKINKNK